MKRAFTLVELIFVIIIVGILAISISPLFKKDTLIPATNQVLDHIRYTQQLALNQDMYVSSQDYSVFGGDAKEKDSKQWFKKWWQFFIKKDEGSYAIFSNHPTDKDNNEYHGQPEFPGQIAIDPATRKYIVGTWTGNSVPGEEEKLPQANLFEEYGVTAAISGCRYNTQRILFDSFGRPHCGKSVNGGGDASLYPYSELRLQYLPVMLSDENEKSLICITPITGYAYVKGYEKIDENNLVCP